MTQYTLSNFGDYVRKALKNIDAHNERYEIAHKGPTLHVNGVANVLVFAYEQLRGVSENIEDHLLLQRAILRFFKRNLIYSPRGQEDSLGTELVFELTQAQYLENDTVPLEVIEKIDSLIDELLQAQQKIIAQGNGVSTKTAEKWLLDLLAVRTEKLINSPVKMLSFAHVAHAHFSELIDYDQIIDLEEQIDAKDYPALLYIAIHRALLKSDDANARSGLLDLYSTTLSDIEHLVEFNQKYDELTASKSASKLARFITKNGAPLRILKASFFQKDKSYPSEDLKNSAKTMLAISSQIDTEYKQLKKNVNRGVIKSVLFLFITKALIGLLIEIPYDLLVTGAIILLPLIVNLLIPPVFLAITALTFRRPGQANKEALLSYTKSMLYETDQPRPKLQYAEPLRNSSVFNVVYVLVILGAFYLLGTRLAGLGFNAVQGIIFIVFFSTASFLGYRITLQIRELEYIRTNQGLIALIRDFLYSPFIFLGQKISYRFSQLNIIAQILDIAVDLPLKTFIRLLRQWLAFLNSKKDELL